MKAKPYLLAALFCLLATTGARAQKNITVFDKVTFYDGYLVSDIPADAPDEGCHRLYTCLNTTRLSDETLDAIGEHLTIDVTIYPLCDNYDRIGSVNLALVPKGSDSYRVNFDAGDPARIEVGRFITPFMNKNRRPNKVPYTFEVDYLSNILRDSNLRARYDFWLELMVFGVPYAAQKEITGCAGCNDVFAGSVSLVTDEAPAEAIATNVLVPVTIRTGDWLPDRGINNYNPACTDEVGRTVKTYTFEVPERCADGRLVLVMSNHGADTNGEEYNRRNHFVYVDGELSLTFKPGRESCEPFRRYNTQTNGIYGVLPRTDEVWQSFSNWCPGDVIDTRLIEMGQVQPGTHTMRIEVPDAEFYGGDGYFPVSVYFQGDTAGRLPQALIPAVCTDDYESSVTVSGGEIRISAPGTVTAASLYTPAGQLVSTGTPTGTSATIPAADISAGVYVVTVETATTREAHKIRL